MCEQDVLARVTGTAPQSGFEKPPHVWQPQPVNSRSYSVFQSALAWRVRVVGRHRRACRDAGPGSPGSG